MKKLLTKIIAGVLLLATVVTGGFMFNLNQEAEARMITPVCIQSGTSTTNNKLSYKPCNHTTINVECKYGEGVVKVVTQNGKYSHEHKHAWAYDTTTENNLHETTTKTAVLTRVESVQGTVNRKTGVSKNVWVWGEKIVASNKPQKNYQGTGTYTCSECELSKTSSIGIVTIVTPCCNQTIKINAQTGKIL